MHVHTLELGRVEIGPGLTVGTLATINAAASTAISTVSTSRDGLVESATGSSTIRRVQVIESDTYSVQP
jgi:hypothetical protein